MLPDFPNAKRAIRKAQEVFFEGRQKELLGPYFSEVPKRMMPEGNSLKQVYSTEMEHQTTLKPIVTTFNYTVDEILADPWIIFERIGKSAEEFVNQQMQLTFESLNSVLKKIGNVVQTGGDFTIDNFLDALEKVEIPFDENDQPRLPQLLAGPQMIDKMIASLKEHENDPARQGRMQQIIETKRKDWHDRKNSRKLVD